MEGPADAAAVRAAVDAPIHTLGGATWARNKAGLAALEARVKREPVPPAAVVLTDPDAAGRAARGDLARALASTSPSLPIYHAFIPLREATAASDVRQKVAGNVGVEHASPAVLAAALRGARKSRPQAAAPSLNGAPPPSATTGPFTAADLAARGLTAAFDAGEGGGSGLSTSARRSAVCALLGIGPCTGAQLLTALNGWGFQVADLEAALAEVEKGEGGEVKPV